MYRDSYSRRPRQASPPVWALIALFAQACGGSRVAEPVSGTDASTQGPDAAQEVDGDSTVTDASAVTDAPVFDPGPEPSVPLRPTFGEVTVIQLDLPAGLTVRMGEAAVIVGPEGSLVLLDVGNSNQHDVVRDVVRELNTEHLTPARGFAAREPLQVEWIIATHFHGDHIGGLHALLVEADEPLALVSGLVHRGLVDLGAGMNTSDYEELCSAVRGPLATRDLPLCAASADPPCEFDSLEHPYVATGCPGLFLGDLADPDDDDVSEGSFIDLGADARIRLFGANGRFSDGATAIAIAPFGHDTGDEENARSLAGVLEHGEFRYYFGGDLHGRPSDGPDVESHLVAISADWFLGSLGADVIHAHHHARRTASNATFVQATSPNDGLSRNVIAGINDAHLGSPYPEVLAAWGDDDRLREGRIWVTAIAAGGASSGATVNADGPLILQTIQRGLGYRIQAAGSQLMSRAFLSVRSEAQP